MSTHLRLPGTFSTSVNQENWLQTRAAARQQGIELPVSLLRFGFTVLGDCESNRLEQALQMIVYRHPALRMFFGIDLLVSPSERDRRVDSFRRTGVIQERCHLYSVADDVGITVTKTDLTGQNEEEREKTIRRLTAEEDMRHFRDTEVPRLRAHLLRIRRGEQIVILFADHLVCDGFSVGIIRKEFEHFVKQQFQGISPSFEPPHGSFMRFLSWQNLALKSSYYSDAIAYWQQQWSDFASARLAFADLPFKRPHIAVSELTFATQRVFLSNPESVRVRYLARKHVTTLFVIFLAALSITLSRYTGKSRIAIWTHLANRAQASSLDAVGWFHNSHIIGIALAKTQSDQELICQVKESVANAITHQEVPLPHLWRVVGSAPWFNDARVLLDFRLVAKSNLSAGREEILRIIPARLPDSVAPRFSNLGIYILDDGENLTVAANYAASRFRNEDMKQFLQALQSEVLHLSEGPT